MTALFNIGRELAYQFSVRGALISRLALILEYYLRYAVWRLSGKSQGDSRMATLLSLGERGMTSRVVRVLSQQGKKMELDIFSACFLLMEIEGERTYEQFESFLPRRGDVVIDVGAHQGLFAVGAAQKSGPQGKVLAIEPFPANFELLKRNIAANNLSNVILVQGAAADHSGRTVLHTTNVISGGQSIVYDSPERHDLEISVDTIDHMTETFGIKPDLIKIDVEGSCMIVLQGARKTLLAKPRLVMEVEFGPSAVEEVASFLREIGYSPKVQGSMIYAEAA